MLFTVLAKPPSDPKLSQLSSEAEAEEEEQDDMETLRKLLRLILLDGGWAADFYDKTRNEKHASCTCNN